MSGSNEKVVDHYSRYFQMIHATTEELKTLAYQLRHQIYRVECGFLNLGNSVNQDKEVDDYDKYSSHALLIHKPTQQVIGCIRLVPKTQQHNHPLPIESAYSGTIELNKTPLKNLQGIDVSEISRIAIAASFRQRLSCTYDSSQQLTESDAHNRYPINYLPMSLMMAAMHFGFRDGIEYGFAFIESSFAKMLSRLGVKFEQVGKPAEYFGLRTPYLVYGDDTYMNLSPDFRELFDKISSELSASQ